MIRTCANPWCGTEFEITDSDLAFYESVSPVFNGKKELIPPPTLCPDCRYQRRLAFRNERKLYHRKCDKTGKQMVSAFSPDKPNIVYENPAWWSESWDGLDFGEPVNFSRPFFDQLKHLIGVTPHINLLNVNSENSEYTHNATYNKNCYMLFCGSFNEDCLYSYWIQNSTSCIDCSSVRRSERCYECNECFRGYDLTYCRTSANCQTSRYLAYCLNCTNCVGCVGMRNASYCWLNERLTKEGYEERLKNLLTNPEAQAALQKSFEELLIKIPVPWSYQRMTENCTGNYIYESQNCRDCFNTRQSQDCAHCQFIADVKESMDVSFFGLPAELLYECNNYGIGSYHCLFGNWGYGDKDIFYCYNCHFCENCFGCVNLHHKKYCILNRQYSRDEYETLVPKLIDQMRKSGEWGEFPPVQLSLFAYNETVAEEAFPLTKEEVLKRGWKWKDETDEAPQVSKIILAKDLQANIDEIPDDILNWAIECEATKRPFRIVKQELDFYRRMDLPVPHFHPDERHRRRMALRNPRKLWDRECDKCGQAIETSYSPERQERGFCEECYLKEVY